MDGVLADFKAGLKLAAPKLDLNNPGAEAAIDRVISDPNFFATLPHIKGGVLSVKMLIKQRYEVFFLTTVPWNAKNAYDGKKIWLQKQFGKKAEKRLITAHYKNLLSGDYLIDDRTKNGAGKFQGCFIHFGTEKFPDWNAVLEYINNKES